MNKLLSIEVANQPDFKSRMKQMLGFGASILFRHRRITLSQNPSGQPNGLLDKALMAYLKRKAIIEKDDQFFERLHQDFWQGNGGKLFASNCDHRFEDLFLAQQTADLAALQKQWRENEVNQIVEFGCSSGLVLGHLVDNLKGVNQAHGIDLNQAQIDANLSSGKFDHRINFHCADGGEWLFENGRPNTLFVSNGGVLEYFRRDRLDEMFRFISQNLRPAIFFSIEPVAHDHDWSLTSDSIPFGEELSFSHNYFELFESNGFKVIHKRPTDFESWRMMAIVAIAN